MVLVEIADGVCVNPEMVIAVKKDKDGVVRVITLEMCGNHDYTIADKSDYTYEETVMRLTGVNYRNQL